MPMYQYTCPACGWQGERIVKIADRDEQLCEVRVILKADIHSASFGPDGRTGLAGVVEDSALCQAKLVREEIALNAKMGHRWMP